MSVCIVIATEHDLHADSVVDRLRGKSQIIRIDPLNYIPSLSFRSESSKCQIGDIRFHLNDVTGIICRVALESVSLEFLVDPVQKFAAREHLDALIGVLLNIPETKWINFPWNDSIADGKIYPLILAARAGIRVPPFVVSSNRKYLFEFDSLCGPSIIKPLSDMSIARQAGRFVEIPEMAEFDAPYTTDFDPGRLMDGEAEDETPTLVQKKIQKRGDVRVVVVDRQVFASYMPKKHSIVDSRMAKERDEFVFYLDAGLSENIIHLTHNILNLRFATMDFIHGIDDVLYLVDVNPSGNFLWQETMLGIPISSALSEGLL